MSRFAYTLGFAASYDQAIADSTEEDPVYKTGAHDNYSGGWVWKTGQEALAFRNSELFAAAFPNLDPETFAVYSLKLPISWFIDASAAPDLLDGVHRLLHDAPIIGRWAG